MSTSTVGDIYELSPLQLGMLLHSLFADDGEMYVAQHSFQVTGPLDAGALETAWQQVVADHAPLRTSFHWEELSKPLQVVHDHAPLPLRREDWSDLPAGEQEERLARLLAEERAAGFDLASPPLMRLRLVALGAERHRFVWTHHMLLLDGWSVPIVTRDVLRRYRMVLGGAADPGPAPAQYGDYIQWLQRQDHAAAEAFWREALAGFDGATSLAGASPAGPPEGPVEVADHVVTPSADVVAGLHVLAAGHQVTLSTVLQAAWALLLQHASGEGEVVFGVTSSGRPAELPGVDAMVGSFINTLPLRLPVPDFGEVGQWLRDVQRRYAAVRRYEYTPLAQVKKWLGVPGLQPLFESVLVFDNYPVSVELGDLSQRLSFSSDASFEKTSEPLSLLVTSEPELTLRLLFHRHRFSGEAAARLMDCFLATLEALARKPDPDVASVAAAGAVTAPAWGRGPRAALNTEGAGLAAVVARGTGRAPDAVAVVAEEGELRYHDLHARAQALASWLVGRGVRVGDVVGVCMERSLDMIVALLGVVQAGAAWLPLEPSSPPERLRWMVEDARPRVLLAQERLAPLLDGAGDVLCLDAQWGEVAAATPVPPGGLPLAAGRDPAYVLYTSGSTGRPKGVVVSHEAICNRLLWMQEHFGLDAGDRVLQKTPFGFDVSVWEFFWPLLAGARLVMARPGGHLDARYLVDVMAREGVTTVHFVPSMLQLFVEEPLAATLAGSGALRRVVCSGEALPPDLARRARAVLGGAGLYNLYGPTEAAVDVTWWDCAAEAPDGVVPIGWPVANTDLHVLDRRLRPVAAGVPGELYLAGVQLAEGYVNRPGLTAERFVANPYGLPGSRLYRTGDRARFLEGGAVEFLGRLDDQVKLRGYRIELGEVEQTLARHPAVREAVVTVHRDAAGPRLAAYVVPAGGPRGDTGRLDGEGPGGEGLDGEGLDGERLRAWLRTQLPRYMVPASFTTLDRVPLTPNGKADRRALPPPGQPEPGGAAAPARSPAEFAILEVFADVLGLAQVGATDGFFDLGGDSLAAVRAVRRIPGATVPALAANPSARELAAALAAPAAAPRRLLRLSPRSEAARLSLVCVPYGGGSALSYQPLARALPADVALHAVTLPGHEFGTDEAPRPVEDVAEECVAEIIETVDTPVAVYGQCMGIALATELTRRLEHAGVAVERLFVAASYPFYKRRFLGFDRTSRLARPDPEADERTMRYLKSLDGFDDVVEPEELAFVMGNFRHDDVSARVYFSERWRGRRTPRLATPITFVAGTADPETPRYQRRYRSWRRFSTDVELAEVPGGGHYFVKHQPEVLAAILRAALDRARDPEGTVV